MIVFLKRMTVAERQRRVDFYLVFRLVIAVPASALGLPELNGRQRFITYGLGHIILYTVSVHYILLNKFCALLLPENEKQTVVYYRLPFERVKKILGRYIYIGKNLNIRFPACFCPRVLSGIRLLFKTADVIALFKMQIVFVSVALYLNIHILRSILRGAKPQAVKPYRILIICPLIGVVFSSSVQLAVKQLPVIALLLIIVINRSAAGEVLHLDRAVGIFSHNNFLPKALASLVYGV